MLSVSAKETQPVVQLSSSRFFHQSLAILQGKFQRQFAENFSFSKNQEAILFEELDRMRKKLTGEELHVSQVQFTESDPDKALNFSKSEIEEEMIVSAGRMKEFAKSFQDSFSQDKQALQRLKNIQDKNKKEGSSSLDNLLDFNKLSRNLGFFQLIKMTVIALAVFAITLVFIWFDALIF